MPQAPFKLQEYLDNPLPTISGELPIGVGSKTPKPTWEGKLRGIAKIDSFDVKIKEYLQKDVPSTPIPTHPGHPFPHLQSAARTLSLDSEEDLLKALKTLPLESTLAVLSAWDLYETELANSGENQNGSRKISLPIEADGHHSISADATESSVEGKAERVAWRFGKSPMGETEFILVGHLNDPKMVVRFVPDNVFQEQDWEEFSVTGEFRYNPKSKASVLWSRQSNGTARLQVQYFVLTSYTRTVFGCFTEDGSFANISPVITASSTSPTVLAALTFWSRISLGHTSFGMTSSLEKVSQGTAKPLFPSNPARRASLNKGARERPEKRRVSKKAEESDVEDSDVAE